MTPFLILSNILIFVLSVMGIIFTILAFVGFLATDTFKEVKGLFSMGFLFLFAAAVLKFLVFVPDNIFQ